MKMPLLVSMAIVVGFLIPFRANCSPDSVKSIRARDHAQINARDAQIAAKDAVIANLRDQVHSLTNELEALKARLHSADTTAVSSPQANTAPQPTVNTAPQPTAAAKSRLSNDEQEAILINKIDRESQINDHDILVHGDLPNGEPGKTNPHMAAILAWQQQLIDLLKQDVATLSDPVKKSEKRRLLNETRANSGLDTP